MTEHPHFQIGSPPQPFWVAIDTLLPTTLVFVPKIRSDRSIPPHVLSNLQIYKPLESTTYQLDNPPVHVPAGLIYHDQFATLKFGYGRNGLKLEHNVRLIGANKVVGGLDHEVLGLGFTLDSHKKIRSIFDSTDQWAEKTFTIFFRQKQSNPRANVGRLTIGKQDSQYCSSSINWVHVVGTKSWSFKVRRISIGPDAPFDDETFAVASTTHSDILLPSKMFERIQSRKGVSQDKDGYLLVPCNGENQLAFFIGRDPIIIPSYEMVKKMDETVCKLVIRPHEKDFVVLGQPLFRSCCVVHDWNIRKIGFAMFRTLRAPRH